LGVRLATRPTGAIIPVPGPAAKARAKQHTRHKTWPGCRKGVW